MTWWRGWLGRPRLAQALETRYRAWLEAPPEPLAVDVTSARWVVVDVEASGLDPRADRLLAIGAVAVIGGRVDLARAFYAVLRQERPSADDNILVHGISGTQQLDGEPPEEVLLGFLTFTGKSPLVAFHAGFDAIMIDRTMRRHLGVKHAGRWLDLALVAPAVDAGSRLRAAGLDQWLERYGIGVYRRHDALADTVATAQLLQVLLHRARSIGVESAERLLAMGDDERWLRDNAR